MRILYQNRDKEMDWIGGDRFQQKRTQEVMSALGHKTEFNPDYHCDLTDYDIVHLFNFSLPWTLQQIRNAILQDTQVVCSMIYHETDQFIPYEVQQEMVNACSALLFLNNKEIERARRHLTIDDSKIFIVPNGIDLWWFNKAEPYKYEPYVLTVGRIEDLKNQLRIAVACKRIGIQYINVGEINDIPYGLDVQKAGAILHPAVAQKDLPKFYRGCKVFALCTYRELMPLSVMEAGAQARNIVLTKACGFEVPNAEYVQWDSVEDIEKAIRKSLNKPDNFDFQNMLRGMTWEKVGNQLNEIYNEVMECQCQLVA